MDGINNLLNGNTYLIPAITLFAFAIVVFIMKCFLRYRGNSEESMKRDKNKKAK